MNHKPAGISRTWHSLWDEMFSAFTALDPNPGNETSGADGAAASDTCTELEVLRFRTGYAHNDNAS